VRNVVAWLVGIVAGVAVAIAVLLLMVWAFGDSDFAAKMTSIQIIVPIAVGARVAVSVKRRIRPRTATPPAQ
jgi:hypothetical protein